MQETVTLTKRQQKLFADAWALVKNMAKRAPYIFKSPYYAHKEASDLVGLQQFAGSTRSLWTKWAHEQYKGMSNYAGD